MADVIRDKMSEVATQQQRPFYLLRPKLFPDGDKWCALYGEDLQEGLAGFGNTPEGAAGDFDYNFYSSIVKKVVGKE